MPQRRPGASVESPPAQNWTGVARASCTIQFCSTAGAQTAMPMCGRLPHSNGIVKATATNSCRRSVSSPTRAALGLLTRRAFV